MPRGDTQDADALYQQAATIFAQMRDRVGSARTDLMLGLRLSRRGDTKRAREALTCSHQVFVELGDIQAAGVVLEALQSLDAGGANQRSTGAPG
jgi:hypothetical protein